jgi:hypothetical protein
MLDFREGCATESIKKQAGKNGGYPLLPACVRGLGLELKIQAKDTASVLSLTLLYIVIARSVSDVPAHRSALLWHAGLPSGEWLWQASVAISERDSFASLGMTHGRLFVGQHTSCMPRIPPILATHAWHYCREYSRTSKKGHAKGHHTVHFIFFQGLVPQLEPTTNPSSEVELL